MTAKTKRGLKRGGRRSQMRGVNSNYIKIQKGYTAKMEAMRIK